MGGGGGASVDTTAQNNLAMVNRDIYDNYTKTYTPLENALISQSGSNSIQGGINRAEGFATRDSGIGAGTQQRNQSRYGINLSAQDQADLARRNSLSDAINTVNAGNQARTQGVDLSMQSQAGVLSLAKDSAQKAVSGMSTAATNEANRNQANQQIAAQNQEATTGLITSGVGIAASLLV